MNRHALPYDAALQQIEELRQKQRKLSKKEQLQKQSALNRKTKERLKATAARQLADQPAPGYELGPKVTVVGQIDLPANFMRPKTTEKLPKYKRVLEEKKAAVKKRKQKAPPPPKGLHQLWREQKGICYYCFATTTLPDDGGTHNEDSASIEHIYPRTDIRRYLLTERQLRVMACYACNQEANNLWQDHHNALYKEESKIAPPVPRFIELLKQNT